MTSQLHTVEKIGGTSMSNYEAVRDNIIIGDRSKDELYQRIFVVSAYGGVTNELLEHKKTGEPGVYALFADAESDWAWGDDLTKLVKFLTELKGNAYKVELAQVAIRRAFAAALKQTPKGTQKENGR